MVFRIDEIFYVQLFESSLLSWTAPSGRKYHYLAYQEAGDPIHDTAQAVLECPNGSLLFLHREDGYHVRAKAPCRSMVIAFSGNVEKHSFVMDAAGAPQIAAAFRKMLRHRNLSSEQNRALCTALLWEVIGWILGQWEAQYLPSGEKRRLAAAETYIQEHFQDPALRMETLARLCGVSQRQFSENFRRRYGTSPGQYLIQKRLSEAAKLLDSRLCTVSQTAELCGFSSVYYFSRLFHARYGIAPSQYAQRELP